MNLNNANSTSTIEVEHAGVSLTGTRAENQDAILVKVPTQSNLLAHKGIVSCIADGVSCSEQSQKASHTAVVQFINDYYATPKSWSVKRSANQILTALNVWLYQEGSKQELSHNGFVTTFSALILKSNTAHLFHVGDTRIYLLRDNKLRLLTHDHQRINFGKSAYLTRALGMDSKLDVDYQTLSLQQGDRFILSSDGLHDYLEQNELLEVTSDDRLDVSEICQTLCHRALTNSSQDNVSCLLVDVQHLPEHSLLEHQQAVLTRTIAPALEVGNRLDGYRVERILYQGSRSHVYQVMEEHSGRQLVMKVPSMQYSEDREYLLNFANEYWVGSQLNSDRVMKVFPTPKDSKFIYQLCELVEGTTLRQWMYDNPKPSLQKVRDILGEIVKATRVFQRADMVHRDLKPENIMITPAGRVKIIDFGAVKVQGLQEIAQEAQEVMPLGAVNYIAPEYIIGENATTRSDLFSIAVMGYEMLTGQLPYKPTTNQNLQSARHTKWVYRSICSFREDLPVWIDLTFRKAAHHLPARRYEALSEFVVDLHTPNKTLQAEFKERPLLQRNPVMFWKMTALITTSIAVIELLVLYQS
ncbi:bifunctional protein-serine/threonine kinase/phosphatase [Vibrio nereis]|uniref:bifunctional protein-serine/threonine kinase/phosphatase n=1 Tax=Vibrio nereis TaxID=693 RepID=UPI00249515A7|nr:bifunctional protein-serine/threonine kinase/phosphatase [Vibrio nereis]